MRFFTLTSVLAVVATLAAAQNPNSFNIPTGGYSGIAAGKSVTFTWSNPQGSTVTLQLRQGASTALGDGKTIASKIKNSGSFTWKVPSDIVAGSDYAIEIIDDDNTNLINYTPQFAISSPVTATPSGSTAASTAASSGASSGSSSSSGSAAASTTGSATGSKTGSATGSATKTSATSSSTPSNNPAPVVTVGGSLLAVALGFAVAF